ncbi:MAG: hypothetical protein ABJE95_33245 [Byssovorax sp.]
MMTPVQFLARISSLIPPPRYPVIPAQSRGGGIEVRGDPQDEVLAHPIDREYPESSPSRANYRHLRGISTRLRSANARAKELNP